MTKNSAINIAFDKKLIHLQLNQIAPTKLINEAIRNSSKFKQIQSSIPDMGIIEPLVVFKQKGTNTNYILLDGHLRLAALQNLGINNVVCLVSADDEAFTYNKHINRISPIQELRMILRAIDRGVSEEKIARALNLDVKSITKKQNLLKGICPEVCELLKEKQVAVGVFPILRKMNPLRQIEVVTLMAGMGEYTVQYARMLLAATFKEQLKQPDKPKNVGVSPEQMARMETEMSKLQKDYELIKDSYGTDVLNYTILKAFLGSLLENARVVRFLAKHHAGMLSEFQNITQRV